MGRLETLDGLRGYFLAFMFLNHLTLAGGLAIQRVNHAELGFVQDAQGFVFLSGMLVGLVYGRKFLKLGFAAGASALLWRALELYLYTVVCIALILGLHSLLPGADMLWADWLRGLGHGGWAFKAAAALLLYQPVYLDILPQYIVYFIVAPPLVWLCVTGRWLAVAFGSAALWFTAQTGLHLPLARAMNGGLAALDPALSMRAYFNVLGWQLLFFEGMVIGALWASRAFDPARFFDPERPGWMKVTLIGALFFAGFRLAFTFGLVPQDVMLRFQMLENRSLFSTIFVLNFAVDAYLLGWLLVAGPRSASRLANAVAAGLTWLFRLPFLQLLGRHSLQVYALHVVLIYLASWIDWSAGPFGQVAKTALAAVGMAVLACAALLLDRRDARRVQPAATSAPA